jgi:DNA polymerase III alpha subunit (gram-positive type)
MQRREGCSLKEKAFEMRFLAIDFETNGLAGASVLPCGAFPTQVSVTAYDPELDEIEHLYDSYIHGAETFSQWALDNTRITLELLQNAPAPELVSEKLANLWQEDDVVAAHNTTFDLETVLTKIAPREHPFLQCQRLCVMSQGWAPGLDRPRLVQLCDALGVEYDLEKNHTAKEDSLAVAKCIQAAHHLNKPFKVLRQVMVC